MVLPGIELIFFIAASMGLYFGFVLKTVMIIQLCFRYCWAVLTHSWSLFCCSPHQRAGWGCTRSWEGAQPGQLTPADQRGIPCRRTSCSVYKVGGKEVGQAAIARGLAGHWSVGHEQLFQGFFASFFFLGWGFFCSWLFSLYFFGWVFFFFFNC